MSVTSARARNPRGRGDQLRIDLLDAAADLIADAGSIDAVSLRAVAARAGVSPTAVYGHFDDHRGLLQAAVLWCWSAFDRALDEAAGNDLDPFTTFRRMGDAYARFASNEPGKYAVMIATHLEMGPQTKEAAMRVFAKLVDRVAAILTANDDPRDPFFVAAQVFTWTHGIVDICRGDDEALFPPSHELLDDMVVRLGLYEGGS